MYFVKTTIFQTTLIACVSLLGKTGFAQAPSIQENSKQIQVKYVASDNDELRFNVRYENNSGNDFKLMAVSENGDVLFQKKYSGRNFKKHVILPRLTQTEGVTFLIRPIKSNVQFSYKVRVTSKVVDPPTDEEDN